MEFLKKLQADLAGLPAQIQHGALWLLGAATAARQELTTLEASSPLVSMAIGAGESVAIGHGVPIGAMENAGAAILMAARMIAGQVPNAPDVPAPGAVAAGSAGLGKVAGLVLACLAAAALTACAGMTPEQQRAAVLAGEAGAVCLIDGAGNVVAAMPATASDAQKAQVSLLTLAGSLKTDPNCPAAVAAAAPLLVK